MFEAFIRLVAFPVLLFLYLVFVVENVSDFVIGITIGLAFYKIYLED